MKRLLQIVATVLLTFGVAASASAQSKELASEGIKAFVEACVRTNPDFKSSAAALKRRGMPVYSMSDIERGRVPRTAPQLLGIYGPYADPEIKGAKVCGVVIQGNVDRSAAATVEKYIADPSFPYQARIDGPSRLGDGMQSGVFAAFPFGRNNVYAIFVSRGVAFTDYGRATMLFAISGKLAMR